jgi:hypothetical protein
VRVLLRFRDSRLAYKLVSDSVHAYDTMPVALGTLGDLPASGAFNICSGGWLKRETSRCVRACHVVHTQALHPMLNGCVAMTVTQG